MAELISIQKCDFLSNGRDFQLNLVPGLDQPRVEADRLCSSSFVRKHYDMGMSESMAGLQKSSLARSQWRSTPVTVQWKNISLTTSDDKTILKDLSGKVCAGELTAIMGASGAGKSTLLNVMSGFMNQKVSGQILVNGSNRDMRIFRKISCYIMQDDHLLPHLTVRESIYLAACLKIPSTLSSAEKKRAVEECMQSLGLMECQNTKASQLSGGQRKRLYIAQELVSDPPIIFLDEPTSGLDSSSCLQCVHLLKSLAKEGRTVVCSIHQPSARIFEIFDKLYMLAEGQCIYKGSTRNLIPFLAEQGLTCPQYHNPTDFVTEVAIGEHGDWIHRLKKSVDSFENPYEDSVVHVSVLGLEEEVCLQASTLNLLREKSIQNHSFLKESLPSQGMCYNGYATSGFNQFRVLLYRSLICTVREPMLFRTRFLTQVGIGVLLGMLYFGVGRDASDVLNNSGFLFFSLLFLNFTALMTTVLTFPLEKQTFSREHLNSWYSLKIYFLAKTVAEIPFQVLFPVIFCSIVYWMTAQPYEVLRFGLFVSTAVLTSLVAQSLGLLIGAASGAQNAVFLAPTVSIPIFLFCGFFITLDTIPSYLRWLSYVSYIRYAYQGVLLAIYSMGRPELPCELTFCPFKEPRDFLEQLDMAGGSLFVDYAALCGFFLLFQIIAYYALRHNVFSNRRV